MQHISAVGVHSAGAQWAGSVNGLQAGGSAGPGGGWISQPRLLQSGGGLFEIGGEPGSIGVPLLPMPGDDTRLPGSTASDCMCKVTLVTMGIRPSLTSLV